MATGDRPLSLFITFTTIFFILNIFVPIVKNALYGDTYTTDNRLESIIMNSDHSSVTGLLAFVLQLVTIPFWTFGLTDFLNMILLIPRIVYLITIYYMLVPTK